MTEPSKKKISVVVIGGGLAGIAAAMRLSKRGYAVTLVETRKRLGGRATSFVDPTNEQLVDNCQHVLMGCCTNLIDLYEELNVADRIEWHRTLYFTSLENPGHVDVLTAGGLPAPMHMSMSLMKFKTLTFREKVAISRAMVSMMRLGRQSRCDLHNTSFGDWLRQNNQPQSAIEKFWATIIVSAINETLDNVACDYALQVFQDGFLCNADAYVMGIAGVPLVELYDSAEQAIADAGGQVKLSTSADEFEFDKTSGRIKSLKLTNGESLEADAFICTVPFDRLEKLCPPSMPEIDSRLKRLDGFGVSPILGIHLWFEGVVMDFPHIVFMHSPVQWVFNKGSEQKENESGESVSAQHLHCVISAAHDLMDTSGDDIVDMAVNEIRKAFPDSEAHLIHGRAIKEKRATFSARPGIESLRAPTRGDIKNLYLAGDWCRSGWPATMEGAVRTGYMAAAAVLGDNDETVDPLVPNLPDSRLYGMIARP